MANIVFTEKFYVNYSIRNEASYNATTNNYDYNKVKLGFATYYEENAAFRKRQATIDKWAGANSKADIIDNSPRTGYVLSKSVTHGGGWNDTSVNWRVMDPLGFELEISSGNLSRILQYCTIEQGMILGECVWGWDKANGSKVVLLPVNCDLYQAATQTTARHFASTIPVSEIQIGDKAEYKNGESGTYLGKMKFITISRYPSEFGKITVNDQHCLQTDDNTLYFMKTPQITGAIEGAERKTREEAEKYLNDLIRSKNITKRQAGSGYSAYSMCFASYEKKPDVKLVGIDATKDQLTEALRQVWKGKGGHYVQSIYTEARPYIAEDAAGKRYLIVGLANEVLGSGRRHAPSVDYLEGRADDVELTLYRLKDDQLLNPTLAQNPGYNPDAYYSYSSRPDQFIRSRIKLSEIVKVYALEAQYKTWTFDLNKLED